MRDYEIFDPDVRGSLITIYPQGQPGLPPRLPGWWSAAAADHRALAGMEHGTCRQRAWSFASSQNPQVSESAFLELIEQSCR